MRALPDGLWEYCFHRVIVLNTCDEEAHHLSNKYHLNKITFLIVFLDVCSRIAKEWETKVNLGPDYMSGWS